ncbi:MAG: PQQ-binding-like beta-propeller repeat protein, partial [Pirellulales bacterium]
MSVSLLLQRRLVLAVLATILASFLGSSTQASDWPMWRYDAQRSGATPTELPATLQLQWRRDLPAPRPAWPEDPRLLFDATYEPVVAGQLMYVASAQTDSVAAYDTQSGKPRWQFFTDGPIRFAPVVVEDTVMFGADDGFFYCLDGNSGKLRWKFNAAPSGRRALGNDRLVSIWPVRGGAVLSDGKVHFTAGVWPFEGSYLYSFDAKAAAAANAPPKPNMTLLPQKSPQGYLVSNGPQVFIPSGRDAAMWMHHASGTSLFLQYAARHLSDYHVTISGKWLLHGDQVVAYGDSAVTEFTLRRPVTADSLMYGAKDGAIVAHDLNDSKIVDAKYPDGRAYKLRHFAERWQIPADQFAAALKNAGIQVNPESLLEVNLCAGQRLYGHWGSNLFAVDMPQDGGEARVSWTHQIEGEPASMLAADDRLFVTNRQGHIFCFADGNAAATVTSPSTPALAATALD